MVVVEFSETLIFPRQIWWEDASRHGHVTKSRNRKLIRVTTSNERLEHKCVDLSEYDIQPI